ncbi:pilus assembly protein PilW [Rhodocyclaceae bacterium]|jgi:type IV pilus assembly protein PilW|nr:pilus assembly protein PilW [Rhodocyclaceae bacterium]
MTSPDMNTQRGLTLVELMIALVLGTVLLLGVTNVFIAQRESFRINENLARMQDSARIAFELMAREIREAGGTPCGTPLVANVVNDADTSDWLDWSDGGLEGFEGGVAMPGVAFGAGTAARVRGTDALKIRSGSVNEGIVITEHTPTAAQFKVNTVNHGFNDEEILMACDYRQAAIFQVTNASPGTNNTIVHNSGAGNPGNCSKGLGFPTDCGSATGNEYSFEKNGFLTRLSATAWYVGSNGRGGRSLYRVENGGAAQEIAEGVTDMQLQYLTRTGNTMADAYVDADEIASWANDAAERVVAVRVVLNLESADAVGSDNATLKRQLIHVVSLRHRENVQ